MKGVTCVKAPKRVKLGWTLICIETYSEGAMSIGWYVEWVEHYKIEHTKESVWLEQYLGQGLTFHALA